MVTGLFIYTLLWCDLLSACSCYEIGEAIFDTEMTQLNPLSSVISTLEFVSICLFVRTELIVNASFR